MEKEEILKMLHKFGLTEYEAAAYSTLVFLGSAKAGKISKGSNIPQSKIYGVLDQLMEKQLVEFLGGRPKEFKAIPPKVALGNLIENKEKEIKGLYEKAEMLSKFLRPLPPKEVFEGVWTTKGKGLKDFINRLSDMYDRTKNYAYCLTRDFTWSSRLAKSVKGCQKRGVEIRTITMGEINEKNYTMAKWFYSHDVKIKLFKTKVHPRIITTDGKEVLIRLDRNPVKRERFPFISIYSADISLARVFDDYMKNLWKIAEPVNFEKLAILIKQKKL